MKKVAYNVLIVILTLILIGTAIYFYFKYNKYMISNTKYSVLSSEITYDGVNDQIFSDGPVEMARNFQELISIEESSDKIKKAFSTMTVNDETINEYFNEDFFKNKNVIVIFDTVWDKSPDISVIREKNMAKVYYNEKGGVTSCGYARFIIVDKDINDFKIVSNQFSSKFIIVKELLIEAILLAMIIIFWLRRDNKIDASWEFVIIGVAILIIFVFVYIGGIESY